MTEITRRRLLQYGAGLGAGILTWQFAGGRVWGRRRPQAGCWIRARSLST
jgi:hypothetical protein